LWYGQSFLTACSADVRFSFLREEIQGRRLSIPRKKRRHVDLGRREFLLRSCQGAALAFVPAGLGLPSLDPLSAREFRAPAGEFHVHPHYRTPRPLDAVLRKVPAGFDDFVTEKYHDQIAAVLKQWSLELLESPQTTGALEKAMAPTFSGSSLKPSATQPVRTGSTLQVFRMSFSEQALLGREAFIREWRSVVNAFSKMMTAEFQVIHISVESLPRTASAAPILLVTRVRFELLGTGPDFYREQRVGNWQLDWQVLPSGDLQLTKWRILDETYSRCFAPAFVDIQAQTFGGNPSYASQLIPGTDYWRTVLDGACGIDIYGHNGVSFADIDGDGFDDLYVCQPAGLPNRLFRNRGDGTFEDITAASGLGILENTACALFADFHNTGRQDVIVVRTGGPLLLLNEGGGKFLAKPDAFRFASPPQGAFTGAAVADYDRDGWLDVYFCLYVYYQGTDQYRYPSPYYDAENGPPNFMMRNHRDGTFRDVTKQSGLDRNNTRFSFCCGWGDQNGDQWPDLHVVNDFGRKNLYRNNGNGTFTDIAGEAGVEDIGAGMSVCWLDYDNDGKQDLYVGNMWTAAGSRVAEQDLFQRNAREEVRALYRKHAMGNSLFSNRGGEHFDDASLRAGAAMGRWAWCSDTWDFDHDGFPDLYIANGMITGPLQEDLNSFFWRQVVANSPKEPGPNYNYDQGWSAINELIRSDGTWSGYERNVFYANNRNGTFSDVSGVVGLDFVEDSRSFALADLDHDGRLEVILKNRNSPQLRVLKNVMADLAPAIAFRLTGKKSNRDAIGAGVTVETKGGRQTQWLQAGSGFLAQHGKELFFGLGETKEPVTATIRWPSGLVQDLRDLPVNHRIWVDEGSPPSRMELFKATPLTAHYPAAVTPQAEASLNSFAAWLLAPVAAPDFSARDLAGRVQSLSALRGKVTLLYFWSTRSPACRQELAEFDQASARWMEEGLQLLAVNSDDFPNADGNSDLDSYRRFPFPILADVPDIVTVYNILYRSLFDRHRDLSLPTSFLLDETGAVVKIYMGAAEAAQIADDCRQIPRTSAERMAKALPFAGISETTEFGRNYLSYGSVFFDRGYLQEAEGFFQLALRDDPSSAEAHYGLGSVYLQQEKPAQAHINFENAVQLQAHYPGTLPNAWNNLGILAARGGHADEGIRDFQRALELDPDHLIALGNLGNAYRQMKRWDDAKSVLQRALQLSPANPEANYALGMVLAQLNDTQQAYEYLQKALAARPAYPEALNNLGILYLRTQRRDQAESSFRESIRVAPSFDQAYLNLAQLYTIEGDPQRARTVLLELLKQHPGHAQAEKELAQLPQ
jgi:tetratricopeptide (TPR) repeat protein